jgi:Asp-tRNA(Asn)/Glu-tRNA(Gln) amidotransferase A subunit family amidase
MLLSNSSGGIMRTIDELAQALATGETTSRSLIEDALARIADPAVRLAATPESRSR